MSRFRDITGQKFNYLTAIRYIGHGEWLFRCDCGKEVVLRGRSVYNNAQKSCGCQAIKLISGPKKDLVGQRFGRLIVKEYVGNAEWKCVCDCGKTVIRRARALRIFKTPSCGCLRKDGIIHKHDMTDTPIYRTWEGMRARTYNPNIPAYASYGGRGIKVCDRWLGEHGFENFLADMGERPSKDHSIDRIDVNGDYCPENCRWATRKEQMNNLRKTIYLEHTGERKPFQDWVRLFGVNKASAYGRYRNGKSFDEIFSNRRLPYKRTKKEAVGLALMTNKD